MLMAKLKPWTSVSESSLGVRVLYPMVSEVLCWNWKLVKLEPEVQEPKDTGKARTECRAPSPRPGQPRGLVLRTPQTPELNRVLCGKSSGD